MIIVHNLVITHLVLSALIGIAGFVFLLNQRGEEAPTVNHMLFLLLVAVLATGSCILQAVTSGA